MKEKHVKVQTAVAAGIRCPHCDRPHTAADCWKLHPEKRPAWMQRANRAKATGGRLMRSTVGDGVQEWGTARTSSWRACLGAQLQPREGEATMKKWTLYVDKAGGSVCPMAPTKCSYSFPSNCILVYFTRAQTITPPLHRNAAILFSASPESCDPSWCFYPRTGPPSEDSRI